MKIAIVGGNSYLAGSLTPKLIDRGHQVALLSRSEISWPAPECAVKRVLDFANVHQVEEALAGCDAVLFLLGLSREAAEANPDLAMYVSVDLANIVLTASGNIGVGSFIYFSTIHVYGTTAGVEFDETFPLNPESIYAESRARGEKALESHKKLSTNITTVRLANVFGWSPSQNTQSRGLVINQLCDEAVEKGLLTIHAPAGTSRNFLPMRQFTADILALLETPKHPQLLNLCWPESRQLEEVAHLIQSRCLAVLGFLPPLRQKSILPSVTSQVRYSDLRIRAISKIRQEAFEEEIDFMLERSSQ